MHSDTQTTAAPALRSLFLVEDCLPIRDRLVALLSPVASIVGFAETATVAIRDILASRPEMVLLDLNLADGSGLGVLRALDAKAPGIEVFVLTNSATPQYRQLCTRLGASGFFDKSIEFEKVRDAIAASHSVQ